MKKSRKVLNKKARLALEVLKPDFVIFCHGARLTVNTPADKTAKK